jgi:hypothetical protein
MCYLTGPFADVKRLAAVKPGDRIVITYTEAALIHVQ